MKVAIEKSGGLVVLSESYGHQVFKDSLKRVFEAGDHSLGLCFKCAFRPLAPLPRRTPTCCMQSATQSWFLGLTRPRSWAGRSSMELKAMPCHVPLAGHGRASHVFG